MISSRKRGWPRALCSRVQLQVPLDRSRSTLDNHNLAGKKEKELRPKSSNNHEREVKSAVSTPHCLQEQVLTRGKTRKYFKLSITELQDLGWGVKHKFCSSF